VPGQQAVVAHLHQTYMAIHDWHLYQHPHDSVVWAFHLQINLRVELPVHQHHHLPRILLHCCFAIGSRLGRREQVVQGQPEVSCQEREARPQEEELQNLLLSCLLQALIDHW
jgi:hypothetical protein